MKKGRKLVSFLLSVIILGISSTSVTIIQMPVRPFPPNIPFDRIVGQLAVMRASPRYESYLPSQNSAYIE